MKEPTLRGPLFAATFASRREGAEHEFLRSNISTLSEGADSDSSSGGKSLKQKKVASPKGLDCKDEGI